MQRGIVIEDESSRDLHVGVGDELAEDDLRFGGAADEDGAAGAVDGDVHAGIGAASRDATCGVTVKEPVLGVEPEEAVVTGPLETGIARRGGCAWDQRHQGE